jgi:hypothetical protein
MITAPTVFATRITGVNMFATTISGVNMYASALSGTNIFASTMITRDTATFSGIVNQTILSTRNTQYGNSILLPTGTDNTLIGYDAGKSVTTESHTIYIGSNAGANSTANTGAIGIGFNAGKNNQGQNSIAIGKNANLTGQNNIFLNATGNELTNFANTGAFYVAPIRTNIGSGATGNIMVYNPDTKEITNNNSFYINSSNNIYAAETLHSTRFVGRVSNVELTPSITGNSNFLIFSSTTGNGTANTLNTNTNLTYNALTNVLTTITFSGDLSGNATTASRAINLSGGVGGSIPYQSASSTTAMLANGTAGQVLTSQGTTIAPQWSTNINGNAGSATTVNVAEGSPGTQYLVFTTSGAANNKSLFFNTSLSGNILSYDPNLGRLDAKTFVGALTGRATSAAIADFASAASRALVIQVSEVFTGTFYPVFTNIVSGLAKTLFFDTSLTSPLSYDVGSSTLTSSTFAGDLSGNATTVTVSESSSTGIFYPVFTSSGAGSKNLFFDTSASVLSYDVNSGTLSATSFNQLSDYRIKENVTPLTLNEFNVDKLNPVHYYNKLSNKQDTGFIAHEVQEEYPFLVNGVKDGATNQSLNYSGLIAVLVKEIQELKHQVKELQQKITQ